jgi:acyl-coenzyme A synthetase/AMP-(fatty) acid ligase
VPEVELERLCRDNLAPYKVPVAFHRLSQLPRNEAGKLVRSELVSGAIVDGP